MIANVRAIFAAATALLVLPACHSTALAQAPSAREQAASINAGRFGLEPDVLYGVPIPIHDPSGRAMAALHAALQRAERGQGQARLAFYGASHVAGDMFTGTIRRALQSRFGDAGHGFVMPAKPWRGYRQSDVNIESTLRWHTDRVRKKDDRKDGFYGLAGMSVSSSSKKDFGRVTTTRDNEHGRAVGRFDLFYLEQPGGGQLDIRIDGRLVKRLDTAGLTFGAAYATFDVPDGPHTFEVRPRGDGEVRLFGVAMDRQVPGVIVDTLGIRGSRAQYQLEWNQALFTEHLQRRRPDLVVLAYGTNEAGDEDDPIEDYEARLRQVVARVKNAAAEASCLLVGPSDRPAKMPDGSWGPRPRTAQLIDVQRRVSTDFGCGFFDVVAFQGGEMAMVDWVSADPPMAARDHVHLSKRGYERLGEVLLTGLLAGYEPVHASR
jgi:lysophospholipase L1-like esterase